MGKEKKEEEEGPAGAKLDLGVPLHSLLQAPGGRLPTPRLFPHFQAVREAIRQRGFSWGSVKCDRLPPCRLRRSSRGKSRRACGPGDNYKQTRGRRGGPRTAGAHFDRLGSVVILSSPERLAA